MREKTDWNDPQFEFLWFDEPAIAFRNIISGRNKIMNNETEPAKATVSNEKMQKANMVDRASVVFTLPGKITMFCTGRDGKLNAVKMWSSKDSMEAGDAPGFEMEFSDTMELVAFYRTNFRQITALVGDLLFKAGHNPIEIQALLIGDLLKDIAGPEPESVIAGINPKPKGGGIIIHGRDFGGF